MIEFDEYSLPKGFVVAVSPGFSQFGQGMERLTFMGLARKISKAARLGFEFAMIDYESLSEMYEPNIAENVRKMKEAEKIEVGLHMPLSLDLTLATSYNWDIMHDILQRGAYSGNEIMKAKFVLAHASSYMKPGIVFRLGQREYPEKLSSHDGINIGEFMELVDNGKYTDPARGPIKLRNGRRLKDWFMGKFIKVLYSAMGVPGDIPIITYFDEMSYKDKFFSEAVKEAENYVKDIDKKAEDYAKKKYSELSSEYDKKMERYRELSAKDNLTEQEKKEKEEIEKRLEELKREMMKGERGFKDEYLSNLDEKTLKEYVERSRVVETVRRYDFERVYEYWKYNGSQAEESVAYRIVAKYMYLTKDPIWFDIVGDYDPDHIVDADNKIRTPSKLKGKKEEEIRELVDKFVLAVAIKYIQGHLFVSERGLGMDKYGFKGSVYEYLSKNKIRIYFENSPALKEGQEGQLRIMRPIDLVLLSKKLDGGKWISAAVDTEHLMSNFFSPDEEFSSLPNDAGKYITMLHINGPRPTHPTHSPIFLYSPDMEIIYKWLYILKGKGMTRGYFIWEMGSYGVMESAVALRKIRDELSKEKPTPPDKLPPEFFGIDEQFEARQMVAIREHAFDPLEGMIMVPEESHTFLSKAAKEKGGLGVWAKEKYH